MKELNRENQPTKSVKRNGQGTHVGSALRHPLGIHAERVEVKDTLSVARICREASQHEPLSNRSRPARESGDDEPASSASLLALAARMLPCSVFSLSRSRSRSLFSSMLALERAASPPPLPTPPPPAQSPLWSWSSLAALLLPPPCRPDKNCRNCFLPVCARSTA